MTIHVLFVNINKKLIVIIIFYSYQFVSIFWEHLKGWVNNIKPERTKTSTKSLLFFKLKGTTLPIVAIFF